MGRQAERVKLAFTEYAGRKEAYQGEDCLYDTISIAPGAAMPSMTALFTVPSGTNGKTNAQTNMQVAGMLSNNDAFLVTGARCAISFNTHPIDAQNFVSLCWLDFKFFNREFFWGPPEMFPGGSGAYVSAASNLGTGVALAGLGPVTSVSNGVPSKHNYFSLGEDGLLLKANDRVEVDLYNPTPFNMIAGGVGGVGGNGLTVRIYLDGFRVRTTA
jgi:hypothetical protein